MLLVVPLAPSEAPLFEVLSFAVPLEKALSAERPGHKYIRRTPDGRGGWRYEYAAPQAKPRPLRAGAAVALRTGVAGKLHAIEHEGKASTFHVRSKGQKHEFRFNGKQWHGRQQGGRWRPLANVPIHLPEKAPAKKKKLTPKQRLVAQKKQYEARLLAHDKAHAKRLGATQKQLASAKRDAKKQIQGVKREGERALLTHQKSFKQKLGAVKQKHVVQLGAVRARLEQQGKVHAQERAKLMQAHRVAQTQIRALTAQLKARDQAHAASTKKLLGEHQRAMRALGSAQAAGNRDQARAARFALAQQAREHMTAHKQLLAEHAKSTKREGELRAQLATQGQQIKDHARLLQKLQGGAGGKARAEGAPGSRKRRAEAPAQAAGTPETARPKGTPPPLPARQGGTPPPLPKRPGGTPPPLPRREGASPPPLPRGEVKQGGYHVKRGASGLWEVHHGGKVVHEAGSHGGALRALRSLSR